MIPTGWLGLHPESGELLGYADRSLAAAERELLAVHIDECEHCQRELATLEGEARLVSAAIASDGTSSVTDIRRAQAWKQIYAAARRVERRRSVRNVWLPRAAAASIVIAVAAFGAGPALAFV
jgi:anti-sigma factor RsiW